MLVECVFVAGLKLSRLETFGWEMYVPKNKSLRRSVSCATPRSAANVLEGDSYFRGQLASPDSRRRRLSITSLFSTGPKITPVQVEKNDLPDSDSPKSESVRDRSGIKEAYSNETIEGNEKVEEPREAASLGASPSSLRSSTTRKISNQVSKLFRSGKKMQIVSNTGTDANVEHFYIHPQSWFRSLWDKFIAVFVVYNALVLPFDIAFTDASHFSIFDSILDVFFIADVVLNLFTAYQDDSGALVVDLNLIRRRYLHGWAWIDIPSSIPFDLIVKPFFFTDGSPSSLFLVQMFKILKVPRLLRVGRLFKMLELNEELVSAGRILKLLMLYLYASHLFGCFFYFVSASSSNTPASWVWREKISVYHAENTRVQKYIKVVLAAFLMLIGENIEPNSTGEQLYTIFVMLIGACIYAIIFGQMAVVINNMNRASSRYHEKLGNIREHMRNLKLPLDTQERVREYFDVSSILHLTFCSK